MAYRYLLLLMIGLLFTAGCGGLRPTQSLGRVAYVQAGDIWTLDFPGGSPRRLTDDGQTGNPRWSTSGNWLLFTK